MRNLGSISQMTNEDGQVNGHIGVAKVYLFVVLSAVLKLTAF